MKHDVRLGVFITFILLLGIPKNPSVSVSDLTHIQPASPQLLPLAHFLRSALDRVGEHEFFNACPTASPGLVFRFGSSN